LITREHPQEIRVDLIRRPKLKSGHLPDNCGVKVGNRQRLARYEVRVGRTTKRADHPWMGEDLGKCCALLGVGYEHAGEKVLAFCGVEG
jgi:hypothetical protein